MRDPNRIPEILARIERMWETQPDMRLGQLIVNATYPHDHPLPNIFYIEDDELVEKIEETLDNWLKRKHRNVFKDEDYEL